MRTFSKLVLTLGVAVLLASPALAQRGDRPGGGPGGRGGFGGSLMLLSNKSVQEELKLSDEQATKAQQAAREVREKHQGDFEKIRELQGEEQRTKRQEVMKAYGEDSRKAMAGVLQPEQAKRLRQIELQASGAQAFANPEVQEALKLTAEQKEKIRDIGEDSREEMREIFESASGDREEAMKKVTELRKETMTKVAALLTADQKESWKELTGEAFEIKFERPANNQ